MADIMRTGRHLSQTDGLCTLYRVTGDVGDDWTQHECVGMAKTPEIAQAICEAVNARGVPLPASGDPARRLLEEALHLRMNGERAPGGNETWAEWDRRAEEFLRSLPVRRTDA